MFDYSSDANKRLFGSYDPTLHSIVVKNKRKGKKDEAKDLEKSHTEECGGLGVGWGWQHDASY